MSGWHRDNPELVGTVADPWMAHGSYRAARDELAAAGVIEREVVVEFMVERRVVLEGLVSWVELGPYATEGVFESGARGALLEALGAQPERVEYVDLPVVDGMEEPTGVYRCVEVPEEGREPRVFVFTVREHRVVTAERGIV